MTWGLAYGQGAVAVAGAVCMTASALPYGHALFNAFAHKENVPLRHKALWAGIALAFSTMAAAGALQSCSARAETEQLKPSAIPLIVGAP